MYLAISIHNTWASSNWFYKLGKMENLLSDQKNFEKVTLKNDAFLNFVVNQEKRIDTILKNLVDSKSMSLINYYTIVMMTKN